MRHVVLAIVSVMLVIPLVASAAPATDGSKVKEATRQVESGARQIGRGVEETAKGIGKTVVEGAKHTGEKLKEAGKETQPKAKSAWGKVRDGAVAFGQGVKDFFKRLFR